MLKLLYTLLLIPFLISAAYSADSTAITVTEKKVDSRITMVEISLLPIPALVIPDLQINRQVLNSRNYKFRNNINIYGDFYSNSNAVTHSFANRILFKDFITTEDKDQVSDKLKEKNRFGAELNAGISYARSLDTLNKLQLLVKYKYNNLNTATFSDDAFNLLFRGNSYFENETADISGLNFTSLIYSQFQAGLFKNFSPSIGAGALISINQGSNLSYLDIENGTLFTADAGEYLEINSNFSGTFSDTSKFAEYTFNGLGASLDMIFSYKGKYNFNFSVQDLGFINWNDKTAELNMDTAFVFEGIEINRIVMAADPFEELNQDSLFNVFGISYIEKGETRMLPLTIKANVSKLINSNWFAAAGVQHRFFENFSPLVYVKADKIWYSAKAHAGVVVSYGGYGGLNIGAEAGKTFGDRFGIKIGSTSIISYFAPNSLTGSSGYFLLSASF